MFLTCISLITNDVDHLFLYLLAIGRASSVKCVSKSFAYFKNQVVFLLSLKGSLYILHSFFVKYMHSKCFIQPLFSFLNGMFEAKVLNFDKVQFLHFFLKSIK